MPHTKLIHLFTIAALLTVRPVLGQDAAPSPPPSQPADAPGEGGVQFTPVPHVEKRGTGPVNMVLIPGLSCDWTVFEAFMTRNSDRYTMYAVTLPGFGGSEPPRPEAPGDKNAPNAAAALVRIGAWLDNAAEAVWRVVQEQKINEPVIAGHSLGGHLALRIGTEHAADIRAVVAIDGAPAFPFGDTPAEMTRDDRLQMARMLNDQLQLLNDEQWAANQRTMVLGMVTDQARGEALADLCVKVPARTTIHYMVDLIAADIRDQLPKLTKPVLVMPSVPQPDQFPTEQVVRIWTELMKGAPNATIAVFENTRHFIQEDRPAELDAAISDFLAGKVVKGYAATQPETQPGQTANPP